MGATWNRKTHACGQNVNLLEPGYTEYRGAMV